jgi:hypothetical protein
MFLKRRAGGAAVPIYGWEYGLYRLPWGLASMELSSSEERRRHVSD